MLYAAVEMFGPKPYFFAELVGRDCRLQQP